MEQSVMNNIKLELLKRIDVLVQRHYRQSLGELMNELYVRHLCSKENPTADEIFASLHENGVLATVIDPAARELHDAVARMLAGTYGKCVECRIEVHSAEIEKNPTVRYCASCGSARDRSYAVVLEAMKSLNVFHDNGYDELKYT